MGHSLSRYGISRSLGLIQMSNKNSAVIHLYDYSESGIDVIFKVCSFTATRYINHVSLVTLV